MSHDDLLSRLGRVAREEAEREARDLDERWDGLARGELSEAEAEELRRENPEAYEAFRPLDEDFKDQVAERLRGRPPGRVLPFPRRGSTWGWVVAASGLAAVLTLLLLLPSGPTSLPDYALVVEGGARTQRSEAPDAAMSAGVPRVLRPGDRLEVLLRPETAVEGEVAATASLVPTDSLEGRQSKDVTPWLEVAESGAVRLAGSVGRELAWAPGDWELRITVGRPGEPQNVWRIPLRIEP